LPRENEVIFNGIVRDITERKRAEESLRESNLRLEEATVCANLMASQAEAANQAKSQFLANTSHEIRTPMNAILGFAEILTAEQLTAEQREFVNIIRDSGNSLLTIINDILDFSKIEAGGMNVEQIECSLEEILTSVSALLGPKATQKGLDFQIIHRTALPSIIRTDPTRLRQCLINLVNNAIKFTQKGRVHIVVSLQDAPTHPLVRFDVEDTGVGVPPDKLDAIFESFTQADGSTTRKFGGTGLGLSITKNLVELHGGRIWVESEEEEGSTFFVEFPRQGPGSYSLVNKNQ